MNATDITFTSGTERLAGTLTLPEGSGPHPTALLIAGSGPLDRDGNYGKKLRLRTSKLLAEHLLSIAWGSLRFDKRGVGESSGDYLPTGFFDELADERAAADWLQSREAVASVVAIGHSAGAVQAGEMAVTDSSLAGAVLLSTTVKTGADTLRWQNAEMEDVLLPAPIRALMKVFRTSLVKQAEKTMTKITDSTRDVMRVQLVAKVNAKWMREFIGHDPAPSIRAAQVPLLAITGQKDVQVDPADVARIVDEGPPGTEGHVVPDVDHILRHEPAEKSNPRRYRKRSDAPLDPRVLELTGAWLRALTPT